MAGGPNRLQPILRRSARVLLLSSFRLWHHLGARRLHLLMRLWDNPDYSAGRAYVSQVDASAKQLSNGRILECGSGLTTVVLALRSRRSGSSLVSLEHEQSWVEVVRRRLKLAGLSPEIVRHARLRDVDGADWYTLPADFPASFDLIVCDGPPGATRGGRSGLGQLLPDVLSRGGSLVLDDTHRHDERSLADAWARTLGADPEFRPDGPVKEFAVIVRPSLQP
ncbi:MAG: class I SAM-dependent methyltransferase [Actinomycetota bacterium]|nr:class I SAM-dependent methyltransferase [Actinomycetota bacterium]